jgi:hypothetical protein
MAVKNLSNSSILQPASVNSMLGDYESNYFHHLETVRLGSAASSVTFSNLSQYSDFQHLQLRIVGSTSVDTNLRFRLNEDTGSNYAFHTFYSSGSGGPFAGSVTSTNGGYFGYSKSTAPNAAQFVSVIDFLDAFDTAKNKVARVLYGNRHSGSDPLFMLNSSLWMNNSAINSISFYNEGGGTIREGSRLSLYGIGVRS